MFGRAASSRNLGSELCNRGKQSVLIITGISSAMWKAAAFSTHSQTMSPSKVKKKKIVAWLRCYNNSKWWGVCRVPLVRKIKWKELFFFLPSSSSSSICDDLCPQGATNPSNTFQDPSHNVDEWMHCISMGALGTKRQREKETKVLQKKKECELCRHLLAISRHYK